MNLQNLLSSEWWVVGIPKAFQKFWCPNIQLLSTPSTATIENRCLPWSRNKAQNDEAKEEWTQPFRFSHRSPGSVVFSVKRNVWTPRTNRMKLTSMSLLCSNSNNSSNNNNNNNNNYYYYYYYYHNREDHHDNYKFPSSFRIWKVKLPLTKKNTVFPIHSSRLIGGVFLLQFSVTWDQVCHHQTSIVDGTLLGNFLKPEFWSVFFATAVGSKLDIMVSFGKEAIFTQPKSASGCTKIIDAELQGSKVVQNAKAGAYSKMPCRDMRVQSSIKV